MELAGERCQRRDGLAACARAAAAAATGPARRHQRDHRACLQRVDDGEQARRRMHRNRRQRVQWPAVVLEAVRQPRLSKRDVHAAAAAVVVGVPVVAHLAHPLKTLGVKAHVGRREQLLHCLAVAHARHQKPLQTQQLLSRQALGRRPAAGARTDAAHLPCHRLQPQHCMVRQVPQCRALAGREARQRGGAALRPDHRVHQQHRARREAGDPLVGLAGARAGREEGRRKEGGGWCALGSWRPTGRPGRCQSGKGEGRRKEGGGWCAPGSWRPTGRPGECQSR
eukprot:349645-Chlamydomonas_euryale.AAC.2